MENIVMLKTGDACPCCGKPIVTDDPLRLLCLSLLNKYLEVDDDGQTKCCEG